MQQTGTLLYTYFIDKQCRNHFGSPPPPQIKGLIPVDSDLVDQVLVIVGFRNFP